MKNLTLILLVLFTGNATYAQASSDKSGTANLQKTVSTAGHTSAAAEGFTETSGKGEYISSLARSKQHETAKEAKEPAKDAKAQAKQALQEQKEAAMAKTEEPSATEAFLATSAQALQSTSLEEGDITNDGALELFASAQGKGQDKTKGGKKEAAKDKATDKTKKELDNHGQKVKGAAQGVAEGTDKKGQKVKEVASAKRQQKPEKVEAGAPVDVEAKAPKSAARPGRGAARAVQGSTKAVGNAAKAMKPVKVGGKVGAGAVFKVGKN